MSNIQGSQIWELCTVPAWGISKNGIITIASDYHHLSKSEVDACASATIYARHTTATCVGHKLCGSLAGRCRGRQHGLDQATCHKIVDITYMSFGIILYEINE